MTRGGHPGPGAARPAFLAVDFFCGAGGATRGLIDAGGHVVAGIDREAAYADTYRPNNANESLDRAPPSLLARDILPRTEDHPDGEQEELLADLGRLIRRHRRMCPGTPLLFAIGAPCGPFTRAPGRRPRRAPQPEWERERRALMEAAEVVGRIRPHLVFAENARGFGDPRHGNVWGELRDRLEGLGYATGTKVVCAARFGVPQYRTRCVLLAVRRGIADASRLSGGKRGRLLVPPHDPSAPAMVGVREAIGHLPPIGAGESHPDIPNHWAAGLPPGDPGPARREPAGRRRVRASGANARLDPEWPSPTITPTRLDSPDGSLRHYDPAQARAISLREAATLQSFPAGYVFRAGSFSQVAQMVGDAVPPRVVAYYATYLANSLRRAGAATARVPAAGPGGTPARRAQVPAGPGPGGGR